MRTFRYNHGAGDVLAPTLASIATEQGRAAVCHTFGIPFEGPGGPDARFGGVPHARSCRCGPDRGTVPRPPFQLRSRPLGFDFIPRGAIAGRGGLLKLIFLKESRKLVGVHCIGDIASEIAGIGQMAIRCGGTMNTIMNMSMLTPTYRMACADWPKLTKQKEPSNERDQTARAYP
jgi:NAD(P) transhydrogenase